MNKSAGILVALLCSSALSQPAFAQELPEGEARSLVESVCSTCHGLNLISRSAGFDSVEGWRDFVESMVDLAEPQAHTVSTYLAEHFPAQPERRPTIVGGEAEIEIVEWMVPTLGQRSRDPIEAPDGSIWWTGMWASLAGRLDPETGDMQEYHLPRDSRPHGVFPGPDGKIWYTGNSNATIGMLDPETGIVTEYDTQAGDPHTGIFHPNGSLYFTSQHAGMLGRLNPETGELREIETEARPYGIRVGADGTLWIAYNGTNRIGAMDPDSMEVRLYTIPNEDSRIRRLYPDSEGNIWYVNSTQGRIGRLEPASGEIREWDSPSGKDSHPYALVVINDVIWYNESGMRPDALVRFDPVAESFQSWEIPSGVGIVRRMWVTEDDNLLIHQSSSNRIGLVRIKD